MHSDSTTSHTGSRRISFHFWKSSKGLALLYLVPWSRTSLWGDNSRWGWMRSNCTRSHTDSRTIYFHFWKSPKRNDRADWALFYVDRKIDMIALLGFNQNLF
jgi:hypothetical protein